MRIYAWFHQTQYEVPGLRLLLIGSLIQKMNKVNEATEVSTNIWLFD